MADRDTPDPTVASWGSAWRQATLEAVGVSETPYALQVLSLWQRSTPLDPWTNNPLGMPSAKGIAPEALGTPYAAFPAMQNFYAAFGGFLHSTKGTDVRHALTLSDSLPEAWRAIHALPWPANDTETDWPSALLDATDQSYRDSVNATPPADRKTSGVVGAGYDVKTAVINQAKGMHEAAALFSGGASAIRALMRGQN